MRAHHSYDFPHRCIAPPHVRAPASAFERIEDVEQCAERIPSRHEAEEVPATPVVGAIEHRPGKEILRETQQLLMTDVHPKHEVCTTLRHAEMSLPDDQPGEEPAFEVG